MSDSRKWREIFGREDLFVVICLALIMLLFAMVIIHNQIFSADYLSSDFGLKRYCSRQNWQSLKSDKDCQNFWFKTFHDPSATFSLGSLIANILLAFSGVAALSITLHGINKQLRNAERLFLLDQRPKLAPEISLGQPIFQINPIHWTAVNLLYEITNIGKNAAIDVSDPFVKYYPYYLGEPNIEFLERLAKGDVARQKNYNSELIKIRNDLRVSIRNASILPSGVIHAGKTIQHKMSFQIPRSVTDRMVKNPGELVYHFCFVVLFYKGEMSKDIYESTIVFRFVYGGMGVGAIPRTEEELKTYSGIADISSAMPGLFAEAGLQSVDSLSIYK